MQGAESMRCDGSPERGTDKEGQEEKQNEKIQEEWKNLNATN